MIRNVIDSESVYSLLYYFSQYLTILSVVYNCIGKNKYLDDNFSVSECFISVFSAVTCCLSELLAFTCVLLMKCCFTNKNK